MTQEAFKTWWYTEGSQAPYTHHDCEEHTMRMCEIAWANGAYKALAENAMRETQRLGQEIEQKPVGMVKDLFTYTAWEKLDVRGSTKVYLDIPPQRKPLTNGEIYTAYITATNQTLRATDERLAFAFARAIEAAHGIKEST